MLIYYNNNWKNQLFLLKFRCRLLFFFLLLCAYFSNYFKIVYGTDVGEESAGVEDEVQCVLLALVGVRKRIRS